MKVSYDRDTRKDALRRKRGLLTLDFEEANGVRVTLQGTASEPALAIMRDAYKRVLALNVSPETVDAIVNAAESEDGDG